MCLLRPPQPGREQALGSGAGSSKQQCGDATPRAWLRRHRSVRGLGAALLLRFSRPLGPRCRNATAGPVAAGCRFHAERSPDPGRPGVHRPTPDPCRARSPGARSRSRTTGSPRMSRQPQLLSAWRSARRSGNRLLRALGGRCAVLDRARPEDQADRCRVALTGSCVANASVQGLAARTRRWAGSKSNDAWSKPPVSFSSA